MKTVANISINGRQLTVIPENCSNIKHEGDILGNKTSDCLKDKKDTAPKQAADFTNEISNGIPQIQYRGKGNVKSSSEQFELMYSRPSAYQQQ